jgi:hypothetical protein
MTLSKLLLGAGVAVLVAAIGWWWMTFGDVVSYGYLSWIEAGRCRKRRNLLSRAQETHHSPTASRF